jgi:hypothetical protein
MHHRRSIGCQPLLKLDGERCLSHSATTHDRGNGAAPGMEGTRELSELASAAHEGPLARDV